MNQIRFLPDTWADALLRPFAMVAPDANVYVEIGAPDLRFAAIQILAVLLLLCWSRAARDRRGVVLLLALVAAFMPVWLMTTGNGRYIIPILLVAGPLLVGLVRILPWSRSIQLSVVIGMLAGQLLVLREQTPWNAWAWAPWGQGSYFPVEQPRPSADARPVTYVTLSSISYSLIAPQFPPQSRWINLAAGVGPRDTGWESDFLARAPGPIKLLAPTIPGRMDPRGRPVTEVRIAIDRLLAPHHIALETEPDGCELLRSAGMELIGPSAPKKGSNEVAGFWLCTLRYPVPYIPERQEPLPAHTVEVLAKVEQMCPRFFRNGATAIRIEGGAMRHYPDSDMKIYVFDTGQVMYKFWRALNPVQIGTVQTILDGTAKFDCSNIRGRSGMPWDREI